MFRNPVFESVCIRRRSGRYRFDFGEESRLAPAVIGVSGRNLQWIDCHRLRLDYFRSLHRCRIHHRRRTRRHLLCESVASKFEMPNGFAVRRSTFQAMAKELVSPLALNFLNNQFI